MSPFQEQLQAARSEKVGEAESQTEEKSEVDDREREEHEHEASDSSLSSVDSSAQAALM